MILVELAVELMMGGVESKSKGGCIFAIIILVITILGLYIYFNYETT